jgi:anti-anti-sigma factor
MQITTRQDEGMLELQVAGRLDAYWADHFTTSVLTAVRGGHHRIRVDLSAVDYISSAGMGALMKCYKELSALSGSFRISQASKFVVETLRMTGLDQLLAPPERAGALENARDAGPRHTVISLPGASVEVYPCSREAASSCRVTGGEPVWSSAGERHSRRQPFQDSSVSIGIGAPGRDWADCRERMGEYLSAAGCVAYLPTDGEDVPDYLLSAERFVPELQTMSSMSFQGPFSHLIRFEASAGSSVSLEVIAEQALAAAEAPTAGLVLVGEVDGLVGAAWCRSPALAGPDVNPTAWPQVREWLTFTTERSHARASGLVAGVVTRGNDRLATRVRPLGAAEGVRGHCHAVAFSYRPLPKGVIELNSTVRGLFESESPRGLLHLLHDDRPVIGSGQSAFTGGACWVVPILAIDVEN